MTTRTFYTSEKSGVMLICDSSLNGVLEDVAENPYLYRDKLYFHSGLPMLKLVETFYVSSVTFGEVSPIIEIIDTNKGCGCF